jgi:bacillolysin
MRLTVHFFALRPLLAGAALFSTAIAAAAPQSAQLTAGAALERLRSNAGGALVHQTRTAEAYTLLRAQGGALLMNDGGGSDAVARALNFLSLNGAALGVTDAVAELRPLRQSTDRAGNTHVHLEQLHAGLPVFGARTVVHLNDSGIYGVSGVFVPDLAALSLQPSADLAGLGTDALRAVRKMYPDATLSIESARMVIYRSGLLEGHTGRSYLAYEVTVRSAAGDVRERVFMDAQQGGVINRISQVHSLQNRAIYTPNQDVPPLLTEGSVAAPADIPLTGDIASDPASRVPRAPTDNLYIFAGGTYALYRNLFGREGYDDGATPPEQQVQKSVYLVNDQCPNAYWNGDSTNYCPGFDADDVVSHEWSHAYTEYTHGLIYQYQSGALNEAYSDIFGETYDLVNGIEGPLGVTLTEGEYFENGGSRWVVGEDLSETAAGLLLRDMWDPDNFTVNVPVLGLPITSFAPSPGSVITSPNYYCGTGDGGGVHTNSGVPNHAYAMLVDGKEFNGVNIPQTGMTKAAHIYFHAQTNYQTPTTNFAQHADALEQSCADLIGAPLNDVLGNLSGETIGAADCAAVAAAMLAVEMRNSPKDKCGYLPVLEPEAGTPSACPAGQFENADFSEDWEKGALPAGWVVSKNVSGDTSEEGIEWKVSSELPAPHTGNAAFVANSFGGSCAPGGDISASFQLDSPEIPVPEGTAYFKFTHFMQSEAEFDGGNLKYSINGADFAVVPAAAFTYNGYNAELEGAGALPVPDPTGLTGGGNTNPIAGEAAWSGSDQGESFSSWGTSLVDLSALGAGAGDKIRFRFEFGQDGCNGNLGWYVDELSLGHCSATPPAGRLDAGGRFGGALGWLVLLPLLAGILRRRAL